VKVNNLSPASSRLSATALHFKRKRCETITVFALAGVAQSCD
jgi:hypothetical protein